MQGDLRIAFAEIGQATDQPFLRQFGGYCDAQLRLGAGVAQLVAGLTDQLEGLLQATQQALGLWRGAHLAAITLEQRRAELLFELANLVADRAVGDAQLGGRATKVGMPGGTLEGAQGSERR